MNTQPARQLKSTGVQRTLAAAGIPNLGPNKLTKVGRGNQHLRENKDGTTTLVTIFNVQAFRSKEDADAAAKEWKIGTKLEKAGKLDEAQEHYKDAMNNLMSFSVLSENASDFEEAYEVAVMVENVENREGKIVLGLNRPRPVAVEKSITSVANLFVEEEDKPATPAPATTTSRGRRGAIAK